MKNRITIQEELKALNSELPPNSDGTLFNVPDHYFEGLASSVLEKIKTSETLNASAEIAGLSPLLATISQQNPYTVPENYFQANIEALPAFTSSKEESAVLSFIGKELPYQAPAGYFANLPDQILKRVNHRKAAVMPMKSSWMRLAAAAMIIGIAVISGIVFMNKGGNKIVKDPVVAVKKASIQELNDFLKSTDINLTDTTIHNDQTTATNSNSKTEARKMFQNVSSKELKAFLDQVPADDEYIGLN